MEFIKTGVVEVKNAFMIKEFDEDFGWVTITIAPGKYVYRVIDVRGWKPRQIFFNQEWLDVCDGCAELEAILEKADELKGSRYDIVSTWVGEEGQTEVYDGGFDLADAIIKGRTLWERSRQEAVKDLTFDPDNTWYDSETGTGTVSWADGLKRDFEVVEVKSA